MENENRGLSKAEQNALSVTYDVMGTQVSLDMDFVKRYLVRGNPNAVTAQELVFFINTCKAQRLNPLEQGSVYLVKFGSEPAQMVIGKGAYMRRAFENPDYLCMEDGITVARKNGDIVQKEGTCLYPGEMLIGGWCRVHFMRGGVERTAFKELALNEYNKSQASWRSKPATMIAKCAIVACLRDAFPKDYLGLYEETEMVASGAIPAAAADPAYNSRPIPAEAVVVQSEQAEEPDPVAPAEAQPVETVQEEARPVKVISKEQRQTLFRLVRKHFGKEDGNRVLKEIIRAEGYDSTDGMPVPVYMRVMDQVVRAAMQKSAETAEPEEVPA